MHAQCVKRPCTHGYAAVSFQACVARFAPSSLVSLLRSVRVVSTSLSLFPGSSVRTGLTRSAVSLFFFIVVHAVGNLHMFKGPDDFNGYGYFYLRLYCTGLGFQASIVEELVLLNALQHIFAGSKRTRDQRLSSGLKSGQLNLSSLFQRRATCAVECVAAHLCGCWRSLFYCRI